MSTLLEGTVRKQADHVRIVAELINAADGRELWSRTFDRALKDIFAVQAEIAEAVAGSLELTLLGREDKSARNASTQSVEAHNAYLQGHFYFERRNLEDYRKAVGFFDEAIRLDPDYALAYAERSEAWTWIADQSSENQKEAWATARNDAEKAVAIDPLLSEAHSALGWVRFLVSGSLTRVSPNSDTRSNSRREIRRPTICSRERWFTLVKCKRPNSWLGRRSNSTRSRFQPGITWPAFFMAKENSMKPTPKPAKARNCNRPPRPAIAGRC